MRVFWLMAVFGLFCIAAESTWLADFPAGSLRIDPIIVAVAAMAFALEWKKAVPIIVLYGILMDSTSNSPFGMSVLSYLAAYVFIRAIIYKISYQSSFAVLFWIAIVSMIDSLVSAFIVLIARGPSSAAVVLECMPAQALIDAVTGLVLVPFLNWYMDISWEKITRPKKLVMK